MASKRRKVVLVIVEGPSDQTALELSFSAFFDSNDVMIRVMHGDITTDVALNPSNIASSLGNLVKSWASKYGRP